MKWNMVLGALVVSVGLCGQSYGFELLDRMLGLNDCGCTTCCTSAAPVCGCDKGCEPSCAAPACAAPACSAPACDPGCAGAACAPSCGAGAGCTAACEPSCSSSCGSSCGHCHKCCRPMFSCLKDWFDCHCPCGPALKIGPLCCHHKCCLELQLGLQFGLHQRLCGRGLRTGLCGSGLCGSGLLGSGLRTRLQRRWRRLHRGLRTELWFGCSGLRKLLPQALPARLLPDQAQVLQEEMLRWLLGLCLELRLCRCSELRLCG